MKTSISYKHIDALHGPIETEIDRHVHKLSKLLKSYEPDLLQLHALPGEVK